MKLSYAASICALLITATGYAQEDKKPFVGEAEAGALIVSGGNDSESYNAKTKNTYIQDKNVYTVFGRYLKTNSLGVESARNWEFGARYERELSEHFNIYVGQKAESDIFNDYIQRDSSEVGLKYFFIKSDLAQWFAELGYRYQVTNPVGGSGIRHDSLGRFYSEYGRKLNETLSFKYWAEYLPNMSTPEAYLVNTEASINAMLNSVFSFKVAYLLQYQNQLSAPATGATEVKYATSTTTMNLVARF